VIFVVSERKLHWRLTSIVLIVDVGTTFKKVLKHFRFILVFAGLDSVIKTCLAIFIDMVNI
jgi:hypothetical protein